MGERILSAPAFYAALADYMARVDPAWEDDRWRAQVAAERALLPAALGPPAGRTILDCSCGGGGQAIPLAELGWRVTATDIAEAALVTAGARAARAGLDIACHARDMRDLGGVFPARFDCLLSCLALDNLTGADDLQAAARGLFAALKPGGTCYLRLRDFDHLMRVRPRYEWREERAVPGGRVVRLEDWTYEGDTEAVYASVFLREDRRLSGHPWTTEVFSLRRRALYKADLRQLLQDAGFERITFLPQPSPWRPYEVTATRAHR